MIDLSPEDIEQRVAELRAENQRLNSRLREEEISHNNTLIERDRAEAAADKLSFAVMGITGRDVGEHSSAHCPWEAAIQHAGEYASQLRSLLIACNTAVRSFEAADRATDADRLRTALGRWAEGKEEES
tara:strand:+ start:70055 stop:70441 length:387 start_codon:yes stop_codon:yes gene_type:complete